MSVLTIQSLYNWATCRSVLHSTSCPETTHFPDFRQIHSKPLGNWSERTLIVMHHHICITGFIFTASTTMPQAQVPVIDGRDLLFPADSRQHVSKLQTETATSIVTIAIPTTGLNLCETPTFRQTMPHSTLGEVLLFWIRYHRARLGVYCETRLRNPVWSPISNAVIIWRSEIFETGHETQFSSIAVWLRELLNGCGNGRCSSWTTQRIAKFGCKT